MPKYKCPITTCNINFEGSIWDITIPAVMHGEGSHKMYLTDENIAQIIEKQARVESTEEFIPKAESVLSEPEPIVGYKMTQKYDWWKK